MTVTKRGRSSSADDKVEAKRRIIRRDLPRWRVTLARNPNLAHHLRDARIKRRLSVAEVADQVGVSQSSIYFCCDGHGITAGHHGR
jgi:hypothetical protein